MNLSQNELDAVKIVVVGLLLISGVAVGFFFVESGALKYKGSSGSTTTIANA